MFYKKCPYCYERIRKKAVFCKHCHSKIDGNGNPSSAANDEDYRYLQNGFRKINNECDMIEEKIKARTGLIFIKHQYESDELCEALAKIDSFVEKMKNDLEEWESLNKLSLQTKQLFNKKASQVYHRLEMLQMEIENREPTWWEKVCMVFKRIFEKLFPFISFKIIAGRKNPMSIAA
jgi:hypothetical protein